jgi:hypothetical protein
MQTCRIRPFPLLGKHPRTMKLAASGMGEVDESADFRVYHHRQIGRDLSYPKGQS